jgi:hypothetical protein
VRSVYEVAVLQPVKAQRDDWGFKSNVSCSRTASEEEIDRSYRLIAIIVRVW